MSKSGIISKILSMILAIALIHNISTAYALTGSVVGDDASDMDIEEVDENLEIESTQPYTSEVEIHVTSWDDLYEKLGIGENTVTIPEGTIVYVDGSIILSDEGEYTINGGGTLKRGDYDSIYLNSVLEIQASTSLNISNIMIDGVSINEDKTGCGITNAGNLYINNCTICNNTSGGISNSGYCKITECDIVDNKTDNMGGGIFNSNQLEIIKSKIENNISSDSGGGIYSTRYSRDTYTYIEDCIISNNSSLNGVGGGICNNSNCKMDIQSSVVLDNDCSYDCGGIYNGKSGIISVDNSKIASNSSNGIFSLQGEVKIYNSEIIDNAGSGVRIQQSELYIKDCIIRSNANWGVMQTYKDRIYLSGNIEIYLNKTGNINVGGSNVNPITINDSLAENSKIGLNTENIFYYKEGLVVAIPGNEYTITESDKLRFFDDSGVYGIEFGKDENSVNLILAEESVKFTIFGIITEDGVPLANIPIIIKNNSGNQVATTTTDSQGEYNIENLPAGVYTVEVNSDQITETKSVTLVNSDKNVDFMMETIKDTDLPTEQPEDTTEGIDFETGTANMPIYGAVAPVNIIDVTLPISMTFVIDSDRVFHGPEGVEIISNSPAPLDTKIIAINKSSNAPDLVSEGKYSLEEWNNMTRTQTYKEMALSLNGYDLSEVGGSLGRLKSAFKEEQTLDLTLEAEYGKAWDNSKDISFTYNIVFEFSIP